MNLMNTTVPVKKPKQPVSNAVFYSVHVVLMVLFFGVGMLLTVYEKTAPSLGEFFYPATVVIGFFVEIVVLAGLFFIEQNPSYLKENPRPKTSGIVLIIVLLCLAENQQSKEFHLQSIAILHFQMYVQSLTAIIPLPGSAK